MPGVEMSSGQFKARLNDTQRAEVDQHLAQGRSVVCYEDQRGRPPIIMTWGTRDADIPGYPPGAFGGGTLASYVPAPQQARPRVSPALMNREEIPQIHRPRVMPGFTEYPDVQLEMRTALTPVGTQSS